MKSIAILLGLAIAAFGQTVPNQYIVELTGAPAIVTAGHKSPRLAAHRSAVRQRQFPVSVAIEDFGGTVLDQIDTVANALIVAIPDSQAPLLATIPGVLAVHPVRELRHSLDHALPLMKVPDAWATLPQGRDSAGAGIKIAILDSGIDVNHPGFSDATLPPVDGFPRAFSDADKKFTNAKIIVAKNFTSLLGTANSEPDPDDQDGHGTGVAMAAAGGPTTSPFGSITGVAPKAYLGNYKIGAGGRTSNSAVIKAIDEAVADGMDVLNLSWGGPAADSFSVDQFNVAIAAIERAAKAGVLMTISAGNQGPDPGTISDYSSAPSAISVGAIINDRLLGSSVATPGVAPYFAFPGDGPNSSTPITGPVVDAKKFDSTGQGCGGYPANSLKGAVALIQRGNCFFEDKLNNAAAAGAVAAVVFNNVSGFNRMAVGAATLPAVSIQNSDGLDLRARLAANPSLQVTVDFAGTTAFATRSDLASFSARGPSIGNALKPDLVAVGEELVTAAQKTYPSGDSYDASGFINTAGTSFSSPEAAGAVAVLKGARPGLTAQQYRSLIINSASPTSLDANNTASIMQAGTGLLNLAASLNGTVAAYPTSLNFGVTTGSISSSLDLNFWNVGGSTDTFSIAVVPNGSSPAPTVSINTVALDPTATQKVSVALSASGLAPGEYSGFLQIAGTQGPVTARVPYWFAVPGADPRSIAVLYSAFNVSANTAVSPAMYIRVLDVAGLPLGGVKPVVTADSTSKAVVRNVTPIGDIPGTYQVDVRMGTATATFTINAGAATQTVVIPVG